MNDIKITKVSSKKYEVFVVHKDVSHCIYTIKRADINRYIVRNMHGDVMIFPTLQDAKAFVRNQIPDGHRIPREDAKENTNWIAFFVKNTKGKKFKSQEESNAHMQSLAETWKTVGRAIVKATDNPNATWEKECRRVRSV